MLIKNGTIRVRKYEDQPDISVDVRELFARFQQNLHAKGWKRFTQMLKDELGDDYFTQVNALLNELKDEDSKGILISADLGNDCQEVDYVLRRKEEKHFGWHWSFAPQFTLCAAG